MGRPSEFSKEVRERAVRMILEHQGQYDSEWAAICSVAEKLDSATGIVASAAAAAESNGLGAAGR